jgi:hypothetical protein
MTSPLIIATLETRNFTFDGVGATEADALAALRLACRAHCAATDAQMRYFTDLLREDGGNVAIRVLTPGVGYRDNEPITNFARKARRTA